MEDFCVVFVRKDLGGSITVSGSHPIYSGDQNRAREARDSAMAQPDKVRLGGLGELTTVGVTLHQDQARSWG